MAEICAWAKDRGMDFMEMLQDIYMKYGFSREQVISVVRTGKSGAEEIQAMMKGYRENPPRQLAGSDVVRIKDFDALTERNLVTGEVKPLDMPARSNVLLFFTADGSKASVRPSGTEPKIKYYLEVKGVMKTNADYEPCTVAADKKIDALKCDLGI